MLIYRITYEHARKYFCDRCREILKDAGQYHEHGEVEEKLNFLEDNSNWEFASVGWSDSAKRHTCPFNLIWHLETITEWKEWGGSR